MTTPQMNEGQLRDVLARVVPEAPDSVADPAPVVRAARVRRRAQVVLAGGAVAVIAVAAVVGGRALTDDSGPQLATEPPISVDPYSALPCPETLPENSGLPEERSVVAVRYCAVPLNGFPATPGPLDALVEGVGWFVDDVEALPNADPARCAAVDVMPTDSRLLLELEDGTLASMPTAFCQDTIADARTVDAAGVTQAFLEALDAQRDDLDYPAAPDAEISCGEASTLAPATPGRDGLVAATWCGAGFSETPLADEALATFVDGWAGAVVDESGDMGQCQIDGIQSFVMGRTDKGDLVRLTPCSADGYVYDNWQSGVSYHLTVDNNALLSAN